MSDSRWDRMNLTERLDISHVECPPGISIEWNEKKGYYLMRENGTKVFYVTYHGPRREGEFWTINDYMYRRLREVRGASRDIALARAVRMLSDGSSKQRSDPPGCRAMTA